MFQNYHFQMLDGNEKKKHPLARIFCETNRAEGIKINIERKKAMLHE